MRQVLVFVAGLLVGAAVLFALASLRLVAVAPPAPGPEPGHGSGEEQHARGEAAQDDGHGGMAVALTAEAVKLAGIQIRAAERRPLARSLWFPGVVELPSSRLAHVGARVEGAIHFVKAEIGDVVKQGDLLAVLDSLPIGQAKAGYLKALAEHELAEKTVARERMLVTGGGSARKELVEAESALAKAAIELRAARDQLYLLGLDDALVAQVPEEKGEDRAHVPIVATIAGVITERHATVGEFIRPEETLFTIVDLDRVWVIASVPEKDAPLVRTGVAAVIRPVARPSETVRGEVTFLSPQLDAKTRNVPVRIEVPNRDRRLRQDMFVEVGIPVGSEGEGVAVPKGAIQNVKGSRVVFVEEAPSRFEARRVEVGADEGGFVIVQGEVAEGDPVVVKGAFLLKSELEKEAISEGHAH